jgi:hypothetical protein
MSKSDSISATPNTLREIFITKGYNNGSHYKRNGIEYTVVEPGRNTVLSIINEDLYYGETANGIYKTDESFMDWDKDPLSAEDALKLREKVTMIVDYEAIKFKLPNPRNVHDRIGMCLTYWALQKKDISQNEIDNEFDKLSCFDTENLANNMNYLGMNYFMMRQTIDKKFPATEEQMDYVYDWIIEENSKKQIITIENIIEKYSTIQNLTKEHQLNSLNLGITYEQAAIISIDQEEYLENLYYNYAEESENNHETPEITPQQMQEKFEEIRYLVHDYQLEAFDLGLTMEQAKFISEAQSAYLQIIYRSSEEINEQEVQASYLVIEDLKQYYQIKSRALGLTNEEAKEITEAQYKYLQNNYPTKVFAEKYPEIKDFKTTHQINAFVIGLSAEETKNISKYDSDYLVQFYVNMVSNQNNETQSIKDFIRQTFAQINNLKEYQKQAFNLGLAHDLAANLSQDHFNEIIGISTSVVILPNARESKNDHKRRCFKSAYQTFFEQQNQLPSEVVHPASFYQTSGMKRSKEEEKEGSSDNKRSC